MEENTILKTMANNRHLTILYASQTGTAEEVAERIWRQSKRLHWSGPVMEMDKFSPCILPNQQLVVFVCSTTGQGEEPDNMKTFWKFLLRRNLPTDSLINVKIAVLGLGDSSYLKYNYVAKRLYRRLLQLGAKPILDLGLADDQHSFGAEAMIDPWITSLWSKLEFLYPLSHDLQPGNINEIGSPRYKVKIIHVTNAEHKLSEVKNPPNFPKLVANNRTTDETHFQDVRLLRICAPDLKYKPGDVLCVQPENLKENVESCLELLKLNGDSIIEISSTEDKFAFALPSWKHNLPCSVRNCVTKFIDLQAAPQRYALQILAHFTTSELERERLLEFCSPEGQEEFFDYCHRSRRTILEVLRDFPHATSALPVEYLFDVFRPIQPRSFSIASASEACKEHIELLVAVVKYHSITLKTPRLGLCSNWMARLLPGDIVPAWIRSGSLSFPISPEIPIIMVGPGTGCAPFRSLVQQRKALGINSKLVVFLGFRNKLRDFHCGTEWQDYADTGFISLYTAFSRDQDHKIYVQHRLAEQGKLVWELIAKENAYFYVAGSSKNMPIAVRETVANIVQQQQGCSSEEAELYVTNLEKCGRYQKETWS